MPPLARNLVDTNAVAEIVAFINSLPGTPTLAPPTLTPAGGTFTNSISVTAAAGEPIYYTLNGMLPTTNSMLYTGPIILNSNATVMASAFLPGYVNSVAATGNFTILPPIFFTSSESYANSMFQMQLSAAANQTYILQASTNLTQWVAISTNTPSTSPFVLTDPNATNFPHRFYRVLLQTP
jgi:chitobiase/beta-hexosaminidase-like protein